MTVIVLYAIFIVTRRYTWEKWTSEHVRYRLTSKA